MTTCLRLKSLTLSLLALPLALSTGCLVSTTGDAGDAGEGGESAMGGGGGGEEPTEPMAMTCADVEIDPADAELFEVDMNAGEAASLSGAYRVTGGRRIVRADLSIDIAPGTVFFVDTDSYVAFHGDATIHAAGTADAPILFCPVDATPGSWKGVQLDNSIASDSSLEHVRIEHAGGGDQAALRIQNEARLSHVAVVGSSDIGIRAEGLAEGSEAITSVDNALEPLMLTGHRAITNLPEGTYAPNGVERIVVQGFENEDVTFHDVGLPYFQQEQSIRFGDSFEPPTVVFEAGVEYQFQFDANMVIGFGGSEATILCEGTADAPVLFTSDGDAGPPGAWEGMRLSAGTLSNSTLSHCHFRHGGVAGSANLRMATSAVVEDCHFESSAGAGVMVSPDVELLGNGGNTFADNAEGDVVEVVSLP
jgi:hypothetical protein